MSAEPEWVVAFRHALLELNNAVSEYAGSNPDMNDACAVLLSLHRLKSEMGVVYDDMTNLVSTLMDQHPEVQLEDGSKIEKKMGADRKGWQHRDLAGAVAARLIQSSIDMDTGEVLYTQEEIIGKLLDFLQPSYWRVKELQKIGINADMFCELGEYKTNIIVRKAK